MQNSFHSKFETYESACLPEDVQKKIKSRRLPIVGCLSVLNRFGAPYTLYSAFAHFQILQ